MSIPERDWKHLRVVQRAALERYCERILQECSSVIADPSRTPHERYLALYRLFQERDDTLAGAFDDLRRSTAMNRLISMCTLGVVTEAELAEFTPETQAIVERAVHLGF